MSPLVSSNGLNVTEGILQGWGLNVHECTTREQKRRVPISARTIAEFCAEPSDEPEQPGL